MKMSMAEKLQTIAENEQRVYEAGIQAERKQFWKVFTWNGRRKDYSYAFFNDGFGVNNFYPTQDMHPENLNNAFYNSCTANSYVGKGSFSDRIKECGIVFDTSNCTNFQRAFASATAWCGDFGTFDIRKNTNVTSMINYAAHSNYLGKINFIVDENTNLTNLCSSAVYFNHISFEGTIAKSLNLSSVNLLDTNDAKTIITTNLKNVVGTNLEGTLSFYLHSDVWNNLNTKYPFADGSTWQDYVMALGWTI